MRDFLNIPVMSLLGSCLQTVAQGARAVRDIGRGLRDRAVRHGGEGALFLVGISAIARFGPYGDPADKDVLSCLLIFAATVALFIGTTRLNHSNRP